MSPRVLDEYDLLSAQQVVSILKEIAEIVGDDPQKQLHLIGFEPMTGETRPVGRGFALLDPLLGRFRAGGKSGRRPGSSP